MRRKRERSATTKSKASPERKPEKIKRTRSKRRKQSISSGNESNEEAVSGLVSEKLNDTELNAEQSSKTEVCPEEPQDQVWQVKTAKGSGDGGEIQKLKICLTRPPSTPERAERSPRSKRKHSRAASLSDSASVEGQDEKKKGKHRTKRTMGELSEISEKNNDIQSNDQEPEIQIESTVLEKEIVAETQKQAVQNPEQELHNENVETEETDVENAETEDKKTESNLVITESQDENNENTTHIETELNDTRNESDSEKTEVNNEENEIKEEIIQSTDISVTDNVQPESTNSAKEFMDIDENEVTSTELASTSEMKELTTPSIHSDEDVSKEMVQDKQDTAETLDIVNLERKRSPSLDKSEILEIHAEESKGDISDQGNAESPNHDNIEDKESTSTTIPQDKVSNEDATTENEVENTEPLQNETKLSINENDVVANLENTVEESPKESYCESSTTDQKKIPEQPEPTKSSNEGTVQNGHPNIVVNRKRRWGSRPNKLTSQKSITISTDVLKEIIPDVKPVEFEEVIEEKKQYKRVEVTEKIGRPILPKIVIDNTDMVEHKREQVDKSEENVQLKETTNLVANRKISIVRDSENLAVIRPPSPPRHKQSNILFITNLVRPFTLPQLKNLLQRTGRIVENGFWIDRIKSKCFVIYENEDQAVETRHALHGVTWPVSNPKTLHVDFSTQEEFDEIKSKEETEGTQNSTIPGTVEDWLREQDVKRERGELDKPWERKTMREWDVGKNDKNIKPDKDKEKLRRDDHSMEKRRHHTPERSPEPAKKFKKKEEAPAKLLDDLFRKTKTTPCIYWLPLSAETIAIKEEQRRQHMAEYERRLMEFRRTRRRHYRVGGLKPSTAVFSVKGTLMASAQWFVWVVLVATAAAQTPFTLEEFVRGQFAQRAFNGTWISDTEFTYTISGESGIYVFDVPTLNSSVLVSGELMAFLNTSNPILSADRQYILAPSEVQSVYRYSTTARFALYEIATGNVTYIANHQRLQLCIFGGGHSLAYVLDNNVYYLPEDSNQAIQITTDGVPGVIYNGHADWVYEEDVMYTGQATWFSTDGSYLAFASYNDTLVETYSYYYYVDKSDPDDLYPELVDLKYPKVGRTNPTVNLRLVNLTDLVLTNQVRWETLEAPSVVTNDHILGGVVWPSATEVAAHWLNRRQNYTVLRICNVISGVCEEEHRQQPNGWVPIALPRFSRNGNFYVSTRWSLEQADGNIWQHLYVSIRTPGQIISNSITPGDFTVNNFVGMDENNLSYYYTRTVPGTPWQSQVHVAGARATCLSCDITLPGGSRCTWATATASRSASYMSITCSSANEPSVTYIVDPLNNRVLLTWEDNAIVRERLVNKTKPQSMIFNVPLQNGHPAPVRLWLPPGLDLNDTTTKYPMVYYVYSGPNTNTVFESFTVGYHSYLTTSRNTIYMLADGRGAGLNGQDILYSLNNALGTVEIEDHFVILRQVLDRFGFIDRERVAIWGHSYGGYATLLTLLRDDDHLFQCGVSGAPVTSWLYYNTMYTERYMGLPTPEDNLAGYEAGDVTLLVEKLRGHDFYIMHGNADDNVHYQNAAKLMRALQELNIPFEQMSYPDEAHSLAGVNMHRYGAMNRYWEKCIRMPAEIN
ncbi:uncharacterized protein [Battus philenor]|uniref:uncharacterized protein n=1 Tax=Battus philenor TaxID=42288 RepID=UPI0035CF8A77